MKDLAPSVGLCNIVLLKYVLGSFKLNIMVSDEVTRTMLGSCHAMSYRCTYVANFLYIII